MFWIILILIVLPLFYIYYTKNDTYWTKRGVKQEKPPFLFGDNWRNMIRQETMMDMVAKVYNRFPNCRYSGMFQFNLPTLLLRDPELIKQITIKDFDHFVDHRQFIPPESDPLWAKNLFSLRGQEWRDMRSTLSGAFTSSKMRQMFGLMVEASENFVDYFLKKNEDLIEFEAKDTFTRFTNDVIATTAFGIKVDSLQNPKNEFYMMGKEATNFTGFFRIMRFMGYLFAPLLFRVFKITLFPQRIHRFFTGLIDDTIKTREENNIVRPDMINLLLEARKGIQKKEENVIDNGFAVVEEYSLSNGHTKQPKNITNLDITAQALIFFFAGFDGVSTLMNFVAYELAVNPEIQRRLRHEVLDTDTECEGKLTYEALLKMKYLDMVVSETLRKWPGGITADRICTKPYTIEPKEPGETPIKLKKGDVIWIPIYAIHRDPKYYPNPEMFDPERFSDENKDKIQPYTYMPFGIGPRNCIGSRFALLETKTVIYRMLLHFEFVLTAKTNVPFRVSKKSLNLQAEDGNWMGMKRLPSVK